MGRKEIVPYALYRAHGFVSPHLAAQTGFSDADLELLCQALTLMFETDRSAARGEMSTRGLYVFAHDSALGNAPAHRLFERISVIKRDGTKPARRFEDYEVGVDRDGLPVGVELRVVEPAPRSA
jgi:CRISPR-associated protein Csd2